MTAGSAGYPTHRVADVVLSDGGTVHLRPIRPDDAPRIVAMHARFSERTRYLRYFSPYPRIPERDLRRFVAVDHHGREAFVAELAGDLIAVGRYERLPADALPGGEAGAGGADAAEAGGDRDDSGTGLAPAAGESGGSAGAGPAGAVRSPVAEAEVAFVVADAHQRRGLGSVLLEHLAAAAAEEGIGRFVAEVLPENGGMLRVFSDAGYAVDRSYADGVVHLTFDITPTARSVEVARAREHRTEAASIARLLAPRSVAVVGASTRPGTVGNALLRNLMAGGFTGPVYPVHPTARTVRGLAAYRSVRDIGDPVDLAILAVPADAAPAAVADCAGAGVHGLVIVSAGFGETGAEGLARQRAVVGAARASGMRVVGPNCLGIANTDPAVALNATLAPTLPARGRAGFFSQSGALGVALLAEAYQRGLGLSSFVSAGNRADVSGNDLLQYWQDDADTDLVLLYLETFGNPRKFARLARRLARRKPVVAVAGRGTGARTRSPAGGVRSPGLSGDARPRPPGLSGVGPAPDERAVAALFAASGVIRVDTVSEMFDVGRLLAHQPLPEGTRVGVVGNSTALGVLAAEALDGAGLDMPDGYPVDVGPAATSREFAAALRRAVRDSRTDALVAVFVPPLAVPSAAYARVLIAETAGSGKPAVATFIAGAAGSSGAGSSGAGPSGAGLTGTGGTRGPGGGRPRDDQPDDPAGDLTRDGHDPAGDLAGGDPPGGAGGCGRPGDAGRGGADVAGGGEARPRLAVVGPDGAAGPGTVPAYDSVEEAVRALGRVSGYARWRRTPAGAVPVLSDVDTSGARELVLAAHDRHPDGVALSDEAAAPLLAAYGIGVTGSLPAGDAEAAVAAAERLGYPVAVKVAAGPLRHRLDLGGVRLDLAGAADVRRAYREMSERLGPVAVVVQRMRPPGVACVVDLVEDPAFGPVIGFGLAGVATELFGDHAWRAAPLSAVEAEELVRAPAAAPLLLDPQRSPVPPVDPAVLADLLVRLGLLADEQPEVRAASLRPVLAAATGIAVLHATVHIGPAGPRPDTGPRRLR